MRDDLFDAVEVFRAVGKGHQEGSLAFGIERQVHLLVDGQLDFQAFDGLVGLVSVGPVALRPHAGDAAHHLVHRVVGSARRSRRRQVGEVRILAKDHERRAADHVAPRLLGRGAIQVELVPARQLRVHLEAAAGNVAPVHRLAPVVADLEARGRVSLHGEGDGFADGEDVVALAGIDGDEVGRPDIGPAAGVGRGAESAEEAGSGDEGRRERSAHGSSFRQGRRSAGMTHVTGKRSGRQMGSL